MIDYWSYKNKSYDPNTRHPISADDLKACAAAQGVEFKYGDILLVRTGWIDTYNGMSQEERVKLTEVELYQHTFVGVDQSEEVADWLHDNYFSVVAADCPAFEVWPQIKEWNHHINLLPLWGIPIGELWDMEKLSEVCRERGQYEFFFTSMPMNVKGKGIPASSAIDRVANMSQGLWEARPTRWPCFESLRWSQLCYTIINSQINVYICLWQF